LIESHKSESIEVVSDALTFLISLCALILLKSSFTNIERNMQRKGLMVIAIKQI